jgi:branched-chain amino acid transport system substrate-binding protein
MKSTMVPIMLNYIWGNDNTGPDLPSVYRIGPYNDYVARLFAKYLEQTGYKDVVILAEDSAYGTDFAKSLTKTVGDKLKVETIPYQAKALDLSPVLNELAARKPQPDAILTAGNWQIIYNLQNQIPAAGLKSQIIGGWDYPTTPQYWETAGKNGVGIIYGTFTGPSVKLTPTGEAFRKSFAVKYNRNPLFYEYFLWDCLNALRSAVIDSKSVDPAALTDALAKVKFEGSTGEIVFKQEPGTTVWNQAITGTLFLKQFTVVNQSDADAKVVGTIIP